MRIAVCGLGYVGLTAAGCLTKLGHSVVGIDVNPEKVAQLASGVSPITEPGLEELLADAVADGLLEAVASLEGRLAGCEMAMVCVGTPSAPDGDHDLRYIREVSRQIAADVDPARAKPLTVVYRSTIRPGTIETVIRPIFAEVLGEGVGAVELVYNPEFLRESVAIHDFFSPPKIVIGTADGAPCANLAELYHGFDCRIFVTGYREAEFTKFVDNTFHALKVTFANEIGRICQSLRIDPHKVYEIFVADTTLNISPYYLRPGGPFGGSCLPKDVRALQHIADEVGAKAHVIGSLIDSNEAHKRYLFDRSVEGLAPGASILMVGLAFKADSDDLRESPNLDLASRILEAGFELSIYDPSLEPGRLIGQNLGYANRRLPRLAELLVGKKVCESRHFDRVVDTNGRGAALRLNASQIIDVHALS